MKNFKLKHSLFCLLCCTFVIGIVQAAPTQQIFVCNNLPYDRSTDKYVFRGGIIWSDEPSGGVYYIVDVYGFLRINDVFENGNKPTSNAVAVTFSHSGSRSAVGMDLFELSSIKVGDRWSIHFKSLEKKNDKYNSLAELRYINKSPSVQPYKSLNGIIVKQLECVFSEGGTMRADEHTRELINEQSKEESGFTVNWQLLPALENVDAVR